MDRFTDSKLQTVYIKYNQEGHFRNNVNELPFLYSYILIVVVFFFLTFVLTFRCTYRHSKPLEILPVVYDLS